MEIRSVRGMNDLFGEELQQWAHVENHVKKVFESFGYTEIRTPALEKIEVFSGTVGDETDIVEKQMYQVVTDSETYVLRPEGTASFMRAVLEHNLQSSGQPGRFFYYLPMFRHERPQKGRLRQFHQFGAELINDASPEADAELITVLDQIYQSLGITEYRVRINSVGCTECRSAYKEKLKAFFQPKLNQLCEQCQKRFERSAMRILDCKRETCKTLAQEAPLIPSCLCSSCKTHHERLKNCLTMAEVKFEEDPYIVRGLDYYTRTAFEFTSQLLGAQDALGGGGRYDGLSARFDEAPFPAVGFGLGMERLMIALQEKQKLPQSQFNPRFFFAPLGEKAFELLYPLSLKLKRKGIWCEISYDKTKGLKWLLKQANRVNADFSLMLGEEELNQGTVLLKNMKQGTQENLSLNSLESEIIRRSHRAP
ncbi:MAG: histidine--tRNA ligase [Deltaproteobacteria bacterium]